MGWLSMGGALIRACAIGGKSKERAPLVCRVRRECTPGLRSAAPLPLIYLGAL